MKLIKNRKCIFAMGIFLALFLLTGCAKEPDKSDVEDYVKKEYGLENVKVNRKPIVVIDYNGYEDKLWEVHAKDDYEVDFFVQVDRSYSGLGTTYLVNGNYYDVVLQNIFDDYEHKNLRLEEKEDDGGYVKVTLTGDFVNRGELKELFEEADDLRLAIKNDGIAVETGILFHMITPVRNSVKEQPYGETGYVFTDGDYKGTFSTKETKAESGYSDAVSKLVKVALDYQFAECLEGMTEEEISEIWENDCRKIAVVRADESEEYYEGICASWLGYGISFGSLYKVLKMENFEVEGDFDHYSFTGADGDRYEISYDFIDELDYREGCQKGYYYLKNDEVIPMDFYFYNHFSKTKVEEMTGLQLTW